MFERQNGRLLGRAVRKSACLTSEASTGVGVPSQSGVDEPQNDLTVEPHVFSQVDVTAWARFATSQNAVLKDDFTKHVFVPENACACLLEKRMSRTHPPE